MMDIDGGKRASRSDPQRESSMDDYVASDLWSFREPIAELHFGALSARVDVSRPEIGLNAIFIGPHSVEGSFLCVRRSDQSITSRSPECAWPVADAYVRGPDLVATYRPSDDWPFSPQIYWGAGKPDVPGPLGSLSLLVSVQTHLLETWPRIGVESHLTSGEVFLLGPKSSDEFEPESLTRGEHVFYPSQCAGCVLWRLPGEELSYVEIMPASDYREFRLRCDADNTCHASWSLFADFLEKGVIWRARLQSLILPRRDDVALAIECCRAINQKPLPLTT
jgi:hypothetical protein